MSGKIGLMVGREWSFPPAFVAEVKRRNAGWEVEYIKLGTPSVDGHIGYDVIVDRISHAVPFYRSFLQHAALRGVRVINDPFVEASVDRFLTATMVAAADVQVPKLALLPHRDYAEGIIHEESLRNLDYPLDWDALAEQVGLPCLIRDVREPHAAGMGQLCHSVDEILEQYNQSGQKLLVAQEYIEWDHFVRCFVVGGEVLALNFDPVARRYHVDHEHLTAELGDKVASDSIRIVDMLGYDINTVDWAIRDGVPWAVEYTNPVPEIDIYGLTSDYFEWVVQRMAELAIAAGDEAHEEHHGVPDDEDGSDLAEELPSLARDMPDSRLQP